jgi:hypothetical protein
MVLFLLEGVKKMISKLGVNSAIKRSRPYGRPLGCRHTFGIKTEIAKYQPNQFWHIYLSLKPLSLF